MDRERQHDQAFKREEGFFARNIGLFIVLGIEFVLFSLDMMWRGLAR